MTKRDNIRALIVELKGIIGDNCEVMDALDRQKAENERIHEFVAAQTTQLGEIRKELAKEWGFDLDDEEDD